MYAGACASAISLSSAWRPSRWSSDSYSSKSLQQRAWNRAEAADVLGMAPPGAVATAVGVRNERDGLLHFAPRSRREPHSAISRIAATGRIHAGSRSGTDAAGALAVAGPSASTRRASGAPSADDDSSARGSGTAATLPTMRDHHARCAATASLPPCMRQRHVSSYPAWSTRPAPSRRAALVTSEPRGRQPHGITTQRLERIHGHPSRSPGRRHAGTRGWPARRFVPTRAGAIARSAAALAASPSRTRPPPPRRTNRGDPRNRPVRARCPAQRLQRSERRCQIAAVAPCVTSAPGATKTRESTFHPLLLERPPPQTSLPSRRARRTSTGCSSAAGATPIRNARRPRARAVSGPDGSPTFTASRIACGATCARAADRVERRQSVGERDVRNRRNRA